MAVAAALGAKDAPRAVSVRVRLAGVLACAAVAYSFSLHSLVTGWRYDTPLADLALVPALGAVLLFAAHRRYPHVGWIRLGGADFVLASLFLLAAFGLLVAGPAVWSKYFWASRLDLLTLPLFVAAAVTLLFGARSLVPFGFSIAFLLLAWPLPYLALLEQALGTFTNATAWGVREIVVATGLASVDPAADGGVFVVSHAGRPFSVSVASACAGVNSLVGFFVVAAFGAYFLRGSMFRRLAWMLVGAGLVWCFNVLRIVALLAAGGAWGERFAFRLLHPVAGLVALNLAAALLYLLTPRFGLRWRSDPVEVDSPLAETAEPEQRATPRRIAIRLALLVAAASVFALANGELRAAARGFSNDGRPAVATFVSRPVGGPGWTVHRIARVGFATPYYGPHSVWVRYRLRPSAGQPAPFTIWLDAVTSPDLGALDAYTLAHCYSFHHFHVDLARRLDLGDGVVGQAFVYAIGDVRWHAVSWQWPVRQPSGEVGHERIVLLASSPVRAARPAEHSSGGFRNAVLALLNLRAPDHDDNPSLTSALRGVAAGIVHVRVERRA